MKTITLASWGSRFWAWLIDVIIIGIITSMINFRPFYDNANAWSLGLSGLISLVYWTVLEGYYGQSVGKMAFNISVVKKDGKKITLADAFIETFGKAFLLPIDCLVGWIVMPGRSLRLFNRASDTIVIRTKSQEPKGIRYKKED